MCNIIYVHACDPACISYRSVKLTMCMNTYTIVCLFLQLHIRLRLYLFFSFFFFFNKQKQKNCEVCYCFADIYSVILIIVRSV